MNCKKCDNPLEEGVTLCPCCGEPVCDEAEQTTPVTEESEEIVVAEEEPAASELPPKEKRSVWKVVAVCAASVLLLLCLSVVVWWGVAGVTTFSDGIALVKKTFTPRENNVQYKDSYSVKAEVAQKKKDTVVATVGGKELTNGELQIFYWMDVYDFLNNYGYYAVYMGLDYAQPLDEQTHQETGNTWQQYFLNNALNAWHNYQAMALVAKEEGFELDETLQKDLEQLRENMTTSAIKAGYSSIDAMLQSDMGPGCTFDDYYSYMETYYTGYMYFGEQYDKFEVTDAMIEAYFTEHEAELKESDITKDSGNLVDVRHILIKPKGGTKDSDGNTTYSEAEWEACKEEAQKVLDRWLSGDRTEERFAELAEQLTEDTGSKDNGGLYEKVKKGSGFVKEFEAWCMDESRTKGDYGLVKTEFGYHIMYFVDSEAQWLSECRNGVLSDLSAEVLQDVMDRYPMTVDYKKIVLGVVDLSAKS